MIELKEVYKSFENVKAVDNISFKTEKGEIFGLLGPNGAGKSTLFNAITGVLPLATGRIIFKGADISDLPIHERAARGICYMRQRDNVFPSLSVKENLQLAVGKDGYERFLEEFPEWAKDIGANQPAGMLSGGQKQKLAWVMTVLTESSLLLFDEPKAGMSSTIDMNPEILLTSLFIEHK